MTKVQGEDLELELVQVLFRHGDRVPDEREIYKTDPHENKYKKIGCGRLTETGILRMYKFGQLLKNKYGGFLGDYDPNKVYPYSSDRERTKISLQAVLSGLMGCSYDSDTIKKQQIPVYSDKKKSNFLTSSFCSRLWQEWQEGLNSPEIQARFNEFSEFLEYLKTSTNLTMSSHLEIALVYQNIVSGRSMGLSDPEWLTKETFETLSNLMEIVLDSTTLTMHKNVGGLIIKQFIGNMEDSDLNKNKERKLYLYSGHDLNITMFTKAHGFNNIPRIPDYGSSVIVEKLRGKDNKVYLRMFYWSGVTEEMIPLKFENNETEILFDAYKKKVQSLLPEDNC